MPRLRSVSSAGLLIIEEHSIPKALIACEFQNEPVVSIAVEGNSFQMQRQRLIDICGVIERPALKLTDPTRMHLDGLLSLGIQDQRGSGDQRLGGRRNRILIAKGKRVRFICGGTTTRGCHEKPEQKSQDHDSKGGLGHPPWFGRGTTRLRGPVGISKRLDTPLLARSFVPKGVVMHQPATSVEAAPTQAPPSPLLIDQVWSRIQTRLEHRLGRIERLTMELFERELTAAEIAEYLQLTNGLAVNLATLGITTAADLVRYAGNTVDQSGADSSEAIAVSSLLDDTRLAIASTVGEAMAREPIGRHLLVVGPQSIEGDQLIWVAIMRGLRVTYHEQSLVKLGSGEKIPDVVVVVAPDPDLGAARPLLRAVEQSFYNVPVIALSTANTLPQRLRAVEHITTIMPMISHPDDLMDEINLLGARSRKSASILTIGRASEWFSAKMSEQGLPVQAERSVSALWRTLFTEDIDAVVIVQDAFTMSARELTDLIRSDIQTRDVGVIVVGPSSQAEVEQLLLAGADSVFSGEHSGEVAALLKSRLLRRRSKNTIGDAEKPTSVLPWQPALVLIERMLTAAMRRNSPVGLALIQLRLDRRTERDQQLSSEFRRGDLIARLDNEHIVVLLDAVDRATLVARMKSLSDKFNLRAIESRIGCMEFPIDGRSLDDLVTGAHRVLGRVAAENGPYVAGADWRPRDERPADVYILDPDETLGAVLRATIERRGLRAEHETDSLEGLKYLTGGTDRPLPRLLLVELEQRGIGGIQFLRQVQASGRLGQMKTIVFSSRTIEGEMRQTFELGAEDYVAKPFSTPLLLHRIQRALGTR